MSAAEILAAITAEAMGGELQSCETRGTGSIAVVLVGTTPWRIQLNPLERREP